MPTFFQACSSLHTQQDVQKKNLKHQNRSKIYKSIQNYLNGKRHTLLGPSALVLDDCYFQNIPMLCKHRPHLQNFLT